MVSQDYCCWICHSSRSFSQCTGKWQLCIWISIHPSQDTEGWLIRNSQDSACHAAAWTVQESLDPRVSNQGMLSYVWALKCVRARVAKVRPCLHQDRFQTGSTGGWGTGFPFCHHSIKTYQVIHSVLWMTAGTSCANLASVHALRRFHSKSSYWHLWSSAVQTVIDTTHTPRVYSVFLFKVEQVTSGWGHSLWNGDLLNATVWWTWTGMFHKCKRAMNHLAE